MYSHRCCVALFGEVPSLNVVTCLCSSLSYQHPISWTKVGAPLSAPSHRPACPPVHYLSHRNLRDGQAGTRSSAKVRWAERCVSLCVGGGGDEANDVASATGRARARRGFPCVPLHTLSMRVNNIRSMSPESGLCSSKSGRDTGAHDPIRPQTSKLR